MPGPNLSLLEDGRISTTAALVALGGHAMVILAALLLAGRTQEVMVASGVVGVTLVSGGPGDAAASAEADQAAVPARPSLSSPTAPAHDGVAAGERLDRLIAPEGAPSALTSTFSPPNPSASVSRTNGGAPGGVSGAGSSQPDRGLGQGEGAEGIDLYAAASLPTVGSRPAAPAAGDLWTQVAPCWRAAAARKAILMVEISPDGGLTGSPQAVRKASAPADPQTLLAERAAARALQACAPYVGLGGRRWRVVFP